MACRSTGYEGHYEVSSLGRVKSLARIVWHEAKVTRTLTARPQREAILKPQTDGMRILPRQVMQRWNAKTV